MKVNAGVAQGSVLGPLLFLVYINDWPDNVKSEMRLFAEESYLFTKVEGIERTQEKIEEDLATIGRWAYQWKMVFKPNIAKKAVEIIFSVKFKITVLPELIFNIVPVAREESTKQLGIHLNTRLNFSIHVREAVVKATKGINILKMLSKYVDRNILNLSYKLYVRSHFDYGAVIYHDQRTDMMHLVEQVQYKSALIVSGCWHGTNREELYEKLGWKSLLVRRWCRRLCLFHKILNGITPSYLADFTPQRSDISRNLRNRNLNITCRTARYSKSFFPFCTRAR